MTVKIYLHAADIAGRQIFSERGPCVTKKPVREISMKILLICSKRFYSQIPPIREALCRAGHEVLLPNCYETPGTEAAMAAQGEEAHRRFKAAMFRKSEATIAGVDAVLVLNLDRTDEKAGDVCRGYLGGATFLEMYDAFRLGKRIYLWQPAPDSILKDEICGFGPVILNRDLSGIS